MLEILKKYWQFNTFREPQQAIIQAVLNGNDAFALMPTGGGKSICFQVPALMQDGLCLVISPLVALMKDQVQNLQKKGIKAIALTGGIAQNEIIDLLDNCQFGSYKFLYISPERLQNDWILDRIKALPINLIAIDEAHCVSQWGHDFRPAYLKISVLKTFFPKVPFLALTASATKRVQDDIIIQLKLTDIQFFQKSFARENLAYMVNIIEDKLFRVQQILTKYNQPTIIYVTNRKLCVEVSKQLQSLDFATTFYHGGLSSKEKETQMNLFLDDKVQIMVATNAFGMGIDKPNIKTVIHYHLPQNLENYYQEAGRAGRDGTKSFAVLLSNATEVLHAQNQFLENLPNKSFLNLVFLKLCNSFQIGIGEGFDAQFSFNLNSFCLKYKLPTLKTYNAIQFLDQQGIITLSQEYSEKILLQFIISSKEVIRYISLNLNDNEIILAILRTYPSIYDMQTAINIPLLAKKSNTNENQVLAVLYKLKEKEIALLSAKKNDATLLFNEVREDERTINRVAKFLEAQNNLKQYQLKSVLYYIKETNTCKSKLLLRYFGEIKNQDCGICSYCITKKNNVIPLKSVEKAILLVLANGNLDSRNIQKQTNFKQDDVIFALQNLLDDNHICIKPNNKYSIKNSN